MTTSECVSLRIREVLNKKQMTIYKLEQISCISHSTMKALLNNVNNSCRQRGEAGLQVRRQHLHD